VMINVGTFMVFILSTRSNSDGRRFWTPRTLGAGAAPDDIVASYSIEIFASRPTLIQRCVSLRIKSPNC
jgi:hypothetical protein